MRNFGCFSNKVLYLYDFVLFFGLDFFASKTNQIHFAHRINANWLILSDFQRLWEKGRKRRRTYPRKNVTWIVVLELIVDTFKRDDGSAFLDFRKIKIHLCLAFAVFLSDTFYEKNGTLSLVWGKDSPSDKGTWKWTQSKVPLFFQQ